MNFNSIDLAILVPALLAGILVLSTHVPLGREVLRRGIIFIDLAVAQIAALGVAAAQAFGFHEHGIAIQLFATLAALSAAVFFYFAERRWPDIQEAIIGTSFVLAATGSVLLLAQQARGAEHLHDLLAGQILWVQPKQLVTIAVASAIVLLLLYGPWWRSNNLRFYVLFAVAITLSVQLVGVFLVFASLIIPALSMQRFSPRPALMGGYLVGLSGYLLGLLGSAYFDLPAGPIIVWCIALTAVLAVMFLRKPVLPD